MENEALARSLIALAAEGRAHRAIIEALISSHPAPSELLAQWERTKLEVIDSAADAPVMQVPEFQRAYLRALGSLSQHVQATAAGQP